MRKRTLLKNTGAVSLTLILLSGCGIFQGEQTLEEMDAPPEEASLVDELDNATEEITEDDLTGEDQSEESETTEGNEESEESDEEQATDTVQRQLYLLDENGMVAPQTLDLPKTDSVAQQSVEYLIKGGPVTEYLPNGFEAVLPSGTEVLGADMEEEGTLIVDVSKEFAEYRPEDEQKIIEAMTYTLTQFDNVERVKLWINGYEQTEMPVNGTPISNGYSRANGINIVNDEPVDLMDSKAVTLYYPSQQDENFYHVPVTKHIEMEDDADSYQKIVQALVDGPALDLDLLNVFNSDVTLMEEPTYEDGVLSLTFNENILNNVEEGSVSDEVMETLVLTLTEQSGVDAIEVNVDGVEQVVNESGEPYSEPVTRSTFVPTKSL
ncbi:GerMN domain-containing protein [Aquibacillus sediminis]|uniref:GerMN domain-containing protein n=1 Tax=Aquibacillus sediminis TaxID=2574734 RepID=UPI0011089FC1|nr:GerMN domain-containing protein [Aquibacillus sediminis]